MNADSQKSLSLRQSYKFKLKKKQNEPKINLKHPVYYILLWIACVDNYCNLHYILKAKHGKYPKRTKWDSNKKKF